MNFQVLAKTIKLPDTDWIVPWTNVKRDKGKPQICKHPKIIDHMTYYHRPKRALTRT